MQYPDSPGTHHPAFRLAAHFRDLAEAVALKQLCMHSHASRSPGTDDAGPGFLASQPPAISPTQPPRGTGPFLRPPLEICHGKCHPTASPTSQAKGRASEHALPGIAWLTSPSFLARRLFSGSGGNRSLGSALQTQPRKARPRHGQRYSTCSLWSAHQADR